MRGRRTSSHMWTSMGGSTCRARPAATRPRSIVGNLLYSNNAAPKVVDPFITIIDDSTSLKRAVITVTGGLLGGNDTLAVNLPVVTHLTKVWNSTAGTLTLTGTASIAEYEAALQSVTFATSGGVLNLNLGLRTVSFVVTDIGNGSNLLPGTVLVLVGKASRQRQRGTAPPPRYPGTLSAKCSYVHLFNKGVSLMLRNSTAP